MNQDDPDLVRTAEQLRQAAADLPPCAEASKLVGLVSRVQWAISEDADVHETAITLATATRRALDDDPWVRLNCLAHRLLCQLGKNPHAKGQQ
jgi:hypothetical protein